MTPRLAERAILGACVGLQTSACLFTARKYLYICATFVLKITHSRPSCHSFFQKYPRHTHLFKLLWFYSGKKRRSWKDSGICFDVGARIVLWSLSYRCRLRFTRRVTLSDTRLERSSSVCVCVCVCVCVNEERKQGTGRVNRNRNREPCNYDGKDKGNTNTPVNLRVDLSEWYWRTLIPITLSTYLRPDVESGKHFLVQLWIIVMGSVSRCWVLSLHAVCPLFDVSCWITVLLHSTK